MTEMNFSRKRRFGRGENNVPGGEEKNTEKNYP